LAGHAAPEVPASESHAAVAPQFVMLVLGSMHFDPQRRRSPSHVVLHAPLTQACPAPHVFPHAPQLVLSLAKLAQNGAPPSVPSVNPSPDTQSVAGAAQVVPQTPPLQTWPAPHACPQAPQFALSLAKFAQNGAPPSTPLVVPSFALQAFSFGAHVSLHVPL
jgi:hypothetical protein